MRIALALALLLQAAPAAAEEVRVQVTDAQGTTHPMLVRVCRAEAPAQRVAVINHGSPLDPQRRRTVAPLPCDHETVRWFTVRGFAAVLPLRRGYGATGGRWAEHYGGCERGEFVRAGRETARDIAAAIAWAVAQPWARRDGVVVVGQSAGGWGTIALAAIAPPEVAALVNVAGGRGGRLGPEPGASCHPPALLAAAEHFGAGARVRMLWLYTANDSYFSPATVQALHDAFTRGGGQAELRLLPPWGRDGHTMFFGRNGSAAWGPVLAAFLGLPP